MVVQKASLMRQNDEEPSHMRIKKKTVPNRGNTLCKGCKTGDIREISLTAGRQALLGAQ